MVTPLGLHSRFLTRMLVILAAVLLGSAIAIGAQARQITEDDYARAEGFLSTYTNPLVYRASVNPSWLDESRFWYSVSVPDGTEYMLVDAREGLRAPAFDHESLARAVNAVAEAAYSANTLPIRNLEWVSESTIAFEGEGKTFICDLSRYQCEAGESEEGGGGGGFSWRFSANVPSPDGRWEAVIRDHNLWVRDTGKIGRAHV